MNKTLALGLAITTAAFAHSTSFFTISTSTPSPFVFSGFPADGTVPPATTGAGFFNPGSVTSATTDGLGALWFFLKGDQDAGAKPFKWQDSLTSAGNVLNMAYSVGTNGNEVQGFKTTLKYTLTSFAANKAMVKVEFTVKNNLTSTRTVDLFPYAELQAGDGNGGTNLLLTYDAINRMFKFTKNGSGGLWDMYLWADPNSAFLNVQGQDYLSLRNSMYSGGLANLTGSVVGTPGDMACAMQYRWTLAPQETQGGTFYVGYNYNPLEAAPTVSGNVNPAGGRAQTSVSIQFRNAGTQTNVGSPITVPVDGSGNFTVTAPGSANYDLTIKPTSFLRRTINANTTGGNVTGANFNLIPGNVIGDGVIDLSDYTKIAIYFNKLSSDADWNTVDGDGISPAMSDLNGDNVIDLTDYTLVAVNFNALEDN